MVPTTFLRHCAAASLCLLAALCAAPPSRAAVTTFSAGRYQTPENITQAPASFGGYGGDYFIPDLAHANSGGPIWVLPPTGGPPSAFVSNLNFTAFGGVFLPSNWGQYSGDYMVVGVAPSALSPQTGVVDIYNSSAALVSQFGYPSNATPTTPVVAPASFGPYGGDIIAPDEQLDTVDVIKPDGTITTLSGSVGIPFGAAFAPSGFGTLGGRLLVSDVITGQIFSVDGTGAATPFTTVALGSGQTGLRQLAFSPAGWLPGYGSLLFVSVSGSTAGGGTAGDVLAYNSTGGLVASLRLAQGQTKFDPRGLFFTDSGSLLISDSSDPVDLATASDFVPRGTPGVPEPSSFALLALGLLPVGLIARRRL